MAIGSEMSGSVRNVFAERCRINSLAFPGHYPVKCPLCLKTNTRRGGFIEDVYVRGFTGGAVERDVSSST
ncbi:hypothetical protein ACIRQP_32250 [Streptomyces sp. NPDC102274]|uniref:hypothetical protein n=1 Tax=Streptomyces sp. NPDC102274 TaxID=3366151 RepID=UPI00380FA0A7